MVPGEHSVKFYNIAIWQLDYCRIGSPQCISCIAPFQNVAQIKFHSMHTWNINVRAHHPEHTANFNFFLKQTVSRCCGKSTVTHVNLHHAAAFCL